MRDAARALLGDAARRIWMMTFHSACGRILRREAPRLGYGTNFTIYDQADQVRLVKACLEELERDPKRFVPRGIHDQISNAKNQLIGPAEYRSRVQSFYDQTVADVYERYQQRLFASNAVDFDDMLMLTVDVLERFPEARDVAEGVPLRPRRRVPGHEPRAVPAAPAPGRESTGTFVSWATRTSPFTPSAARTSATSSSSSATSRTRGRSRSSRTTARPTAILRAANGVIAHNRERKEKQLWSELGEGEPVSVLEVEDEHAEARFVAAGIAALVEEGFNGSEIAVFYRTNAQSRVLEDVLVRQDIPYQVIGGPRFYERAEVKDVSRTCR